LKPVATPSATARVESVVILTNTGSRENPKSAFAEANDGTATTAHVLVLASKARPDPPK
jgi:hypothetical protein